MASVAGSGTHFKVWTVWSILLVAASGVGVVGGVVLWALFRRPEAPTVIVQPGGHIHYNTVPTPPQLLDATTSDNVVITTGTFAQPPSLQSILESLRYPPPKDESSP
jgi:hypothetical protein